MYSDELLTRHRIIVYIVKEDKSFTPGRGIKTVTGPLNTVGGSKDTGIPTPFTSVRVGSSSIGPKRGFTGHGKSKKIQTGLNFEHYQEQLLKIIKIIIDATK